MKIRFHVSFDQTNRITTNSPIRMYVVTFGWWKCCFWRKYGEYFMWFFACIASSTIRFPNAYSITFDQKKNFDFFFQQISARAIKIFSFFLAVNGTNVARLLSPAFKTLLMRPYEWTVYAMVGLNENHPIRCLLSVAERRCVTMFGLLVTRAIGPVRLCAVRMERCSEFVDDRPQPKCLLCVCGMFAVGAERQRKLCAGVFYGNWIDEDMVLHVAWHAVLHLLRCIRSVCDFSSGRFVRYLLGALCLGLFGHLNVCKHNFIRMIIYNSRFHPCSFGYGISRHLLWLKYAA